jgi:membrane-bound lytic murein transglycosylase B
VSGDSPSVRRRRGHRARLRRVVPVAVALSLPLAAVSSEAAPAGPAPAPVASAPQPLAWMTPAGVAAVLDLRSLDDFAEIARKPPAAPPIRKLPKVRLAAVSAGTIPAVAAAAYLAAARGVARTDPACGLHWWVVAGIGFVESGHAASGGSGSRHWDGVARPPILGPVLDGSGGFAAIRDSDGGRYDGNATWDRAVGPMQFLPSTWRAWGTGPDGRPGNPQAIVPAAAATARYLCAGAEDLGTPAGLARAVFSYNHSFDYVRLVLSVAARYAGLSAADLGVDALPTDAEFRRHLRHRESDGDRRTRDSTGTSGSDTGGSDPSPAPEPATSTSPTPSPTSDSGGPLPQPSPSATLLPLPTTTGLLLQLP